MKQRHPLISKFLREAAADKKSPQPLGIKTMLGTAKKIGPSKAVRTFNRSLTGSCCAKRADGTTIATDVCRARCYVWKMSEGRNNVLGRAEKNDRIIQRPDFTRLMVGAIRHSKAPWIRIHDLGDFDTPEYIEKWRQTAAMLSDVRFWCYTRAWRASELRQPLIDLASLPNVDLVFSCDRHTGMPPQIPGIPCAWFADTDGDPPPQKCHVVFRGTHERGNLQNAGSKPSRKSLKKDAKPQGRNVTQLPVMNQSPVCPHENGQPLKDAHKDCISCRICMPKARKQTARKVA